MAVIAIAINVLLCPNLTQAVEINWPEPNWPEIFEPNWPMFGGQPNEPMTLYLDMNSADWDDVIGNSPEPGGCIAVEVARKAWFWMKGEDANKIRVEVRRKKGFAFPDESNPVKVALKIDINQYYGEDPNAAPDWHGLKKLSLEANSDSIDVISEGVACNIHRMASATESYGWPVWHANWCKLYVNGTFNGIFVFVEQYDKSYLQHRNIYDAHGHTWLYKYHDCDGHFVLKVGDDTTPRSQAVEALCYSPFYSSVAQTQSSGGQCSVPDDANIIADMNQWVDMKRMLSSAAIDAFLANSDPLFESSNNTYFWDPNINEPNLAGKKRLYFPWDVDASFKAYTVDIYYTGSSDGWDELILDIPVFRSQYNQIMRDLLDGPLTFADINDLLDTVEPVITAAAEADPWLMSHINDRIGATTAAEVFDWLRNWFSQRIPNVLAQVEFDDPTLPPGIILLDDGFEGAVWDANWTGTWVEDTSTYCRGASSAHAYKDNYGDFNCVALDTSSAAAVHVDFWLQKNNISSYTAKFYYYNGTTYDEVNDIDALGADDEWIHYTDTITDSNYFIPNFRIQFSATLSGGGPGRDIWVDDVTITKEMPEGTPCDAANLDGTGLVNFNDFAILANDWWLTGSGLAGDIDANDVVNFADLDWMFDYWLEDCQP